MINEKMNSLIIPENDGITHINVYSKGKTKLGRLLSNFAHTPFDLNGLHFESVESFWYFTITGKDSIRNLIGFKAKQEGKTSKLIRGAPTVDELREAYKAKLRFNPFIKDLLSKNTLPFLHYYVYFGKVVVPEKFVWTAKLWEDWSSWEGDSI